MLIISPHIDSLSFPFYPLSHLNFPNLGLPLSLCKTVFYFPFFVRPLLLSRSLIRYITSVITHIVAKILKICTQAKTYTIVFESVLPRSGYFFSCCLLTCKFYNLIFLINRFYYVNVPHFIYSSIYDHLFRVEPSISFLNILSSDDSLH